jgi:hypothetical protein
MLLRPFAFFIQLNRFLVVGQFENEVMSDGEEASFCAQVIIVMACIPSTKSET